MNNSAVRFPPEGDHYRDAPSQPLFPDRLRSALGEIVHLSIESLLTAGSPRTSGENPEHIRALTGVQDDLPPIIVHRPTMRVIDGVHRVRAAVLCDQEFVEARFFDGSEADAFVLAVQLNVTHGLPLSLADRRSAAVRIVASHPHWSDRLVASVSGLSAKTVAEVRRTAPIAAPEVMGRIGRDGRVRPVDRQQARGLARELLLGDPRLSLRQVARIVGMSPETVRAVRAELGAESLPAPRDPGSQPVRQPAACAIGDAPPPSRMLTETSAESLSVVRDLQVDPSLRFTDTGRALLRLLGVHTMDDHQWTVLADNVPPHCRATVAQVAMSCAQIWQEFARHVVNPSAMPRARGRE